MPRDRPKRVKQAKRRLEEELWSEVRANQAYEAWRARGIAADGSRRMAPGTIKPYTPPPIPEGRINLTDPDSKVVKGLRGWIQGYNAQAVTNEHQIVLAAEIATVGADFGHLEPMLDAAQHELHAAGVDRDAWGAAGRRRLLARRADAADRRSRHPGADPARHQPQTTTRRNWDGGHYDFMRRVLASERGGELYRKRQPMIEPVFAQMKFNRGLDRFRRRGRGAVRTEWRLITATHNLLKLHRHALAAA